MAADFTHTDTAQQDFQAGTLTDVVATPEGDVELYRGSSGPTEDLIVDGTYTLNAGVYEFNQVRVLSGGRLIIDNVSQTDPGITEIHAVSFSVEEGGRVDGDGRGYEGGNWDPDMHLNGFGPGGGITASTTTTPGSGGGYGGEGGLVGSNGGDPYGDPSSPTIEKGSGGVGGRAAFYTTVTGPGGYGGAGLLVRAETINIAGIISVNGRETTRSFYDVLRIGGGSGGGILLHGDSVTVSGTLSASGGKGHDVNTNNAILGGSGGGGGRIKVFYGSAVETIDATISVSGGLHGINRYFPTREDRWGFPGDPGTIHQAQLDYTSPFPPSDYVSSGVLLSDVLDLTSVGRSQSSSITWNATIPEGTSLTLETNLSLDGGASWQGWATVTSGGTIPGIIQGTDLSDARLRYRATFSTTDPTVSPVLHEATLTITALTSEPETLLTDTSFILYSTETTFVDAAITASASESLSADLSVSVFATETLQADLFPTVYASESLLPDLAIRAFSLESFLGDALFQVDVRESLDSDLSLRIWAPELTQVDTRFLIGTLEALLADVRVDTSYTFTRETLRADASYILYTVEHQASDFLAKSGTLETTTADLNVRSFSLEQLAADLTVTIESSITGSPITQAIYRKLIRDPYLTSRLSTYQAGPAIFSAEPVPADATLPFIVISPGVAGIPRDTKTTFGREFLRDVRVYAEATGSSIEIENLGERIRTLFHRQSLAVAGYSAWRVTARGPILAPTDSSIYGRLVTLTLSLDRTSPRVTVQQEPAAPTFLAAFYRRLTQDSMLFGSLSSYEGFPAVFTSPPVPRDARPPYIIITPALSDDLRDTKTTLGRELTWEVRVYTPADGSMVLLESLMERVVDLFHRQPLAVEGHTPYLAEVSGPYPAPDGDITTTYGLAATLRLATTQS